jgi:hypothetical protein
LEQEHAESAEFILRFRFDGARRSLRGLLSEDSSSFPCLDEKKKKIAAHSAWLGEFTELAFDEAAEMRWQESPANESGQHCCGAGDRNRFAGRFDGSIGGSVFNC